MQMGTYPERSIHLVLILAQVSLNAIGGDGVATVLAIDNDSLQLELLSSMLKHDRHEVIVAVQRDVALESLRSKVIDLVIVEPVSSRYDGTRLCHEIRQLSPETIILVLSEKGGEEDIVRSLLSVADDYVTKPFSPRELLARIQALLRRSSRGRDRGQEEILTIGDVELNLLQMHVLVDGVRIALTSRELWLLNALMKNAGRVLSRDQLMRLAWGEQFIGVAKTVDVCIQRVRKKISPHLKEAYIHAVRGFGYKFEIEACLTPISEITTLITVPPLIAEAQSA